MKKIVFSVAIVLMGVVMTAQVTITNQTLAPIGTVFHQATDSTPDASIVPGEAGPDQIWDFTQVDTHVLDTLTFVNPATTPYGSSFPFSNFAVQIADSGYAYFTRNDQELANTGLAGNMEGLGLMVVDLEPKEIYVAFPAQYGDTRSESYKIDVTIESPLPGADSVHFIRRTIKETHIDAYGIVSIPIGSFDAIRVKEERTVYDSTWAKIFGFWMFLEAGMDEQTDYAWWSDDPSIGYTLCSMSVDPATAIVEDIDYITDFPVGTHKPSQLAEAVLYPNPASASAVFSLSQVFSGQLSIYDAGSRLLQEYQIEQTASLNLSLEDLQSGLYVYVLKDTHGFVLYSGKFLVK